MPARDLQHEDTRVALGVVMSRLGLGGFRWMIKGGHEWFGFWGLLLEFTRWL